jgi:four helix bundle protein
VGEGEEDMEMPTSVEDLEVFKKAHALTLRIYGVSEGFPAAEKYGLTSQMRRSAVSIGSNLIEGSHRSNRGEYRQFAGVARGSSGELKYQLMIARDLGYLSESEYGVLRGEADEISRMLSGLVKSLARTDLQSSHSH